MESEEYEDNKFDAIIPSNPYESSEGSNNAPATAPVPSANPFCSRDHFIGRIRTSPIECEQEAWMEWAASAACSEAREQLLQISGLRLTFQKKIFVASTNVAPPSTVCVVIRAFYLWGNDVIRTPNISGCIAWCPHQLIQGKLCSCVRVPQFLKWTYMLNASIKFIVKQLNDGQWYGSTPSRHPRPIARDKLKSRGHSSMILRGMTRPPK